MVHAIEVERSGLKLARECTRITLPYDGGEISPVDTVGGVILRFIHSEDLKHPLAGVIKNGTTIQNLTSVR